MSVLLIASVMVRTRFGDLICGKVNKFLPHLTLPDILFYFFINFAFMTRLLTIMACMALTILSSCGNPDFSISFQLPESVNANFRIIYHAASKSQSMNIELVAPVTKGRCELNCPSVKPTVGWICSSSGEAILPFFAERGDNITVKGSDADPLTWEIGGNSVNRDWSEWRRRNIEALRKATPEAVNAAVKAYVEENPDEALSLLLLLTSYSRDADPDGFRRLWNSLGDDARDQSLINAVGRADLLTDSAAPEPRLSPIPLVARPGLPDTVIPSRSKATIIYLWHADSPRRREHIDTLRSLARQFADSASRTIADICLDPDSLSWSMPLASDSLRHTLRGWIPAGEADPSLSSLQFGCTPVFIVASPDSRILYRGGDPARAASRFRYQMNKK